MKLINYFLAGALIALVTGSTNQQTVETVSPVAYSLPDIVTDVEPNTNMIDLSSVVRISCGHLSGTAEVISRDIVLTAYHVVRQSVEEGVACGIGQVPATPIYTNKALDFAIMSTTTGNSARYAVDCKGFKVGSEYFAIGYPIDQFVVTRLIATDKFSSSEVHDGEQPLTGLRLLNGSVYHGMSGGPIVDKHGILVGTVVATNDDYTQAASRELKDTVLCTKKKNVRK